MFSSISLNLMHQITGFLLDPVVWGLLFFIALAVYETGLALGERFGGIQRIADTSGLAGLRQAGKRRIERADFITRIAPMLGLMGTLIPLGPGLAALGEGELTILTTAMTVAFDTTVIGLLAGIIGFVLGRMRRRWYDAAMEAYEAQGVATHG
ncbi:MAG: hypothetical protein ACI978_002408 [Oleispira sp.]|jgi:hypothetical protein